MRSPKESIHPKPSVVTSIVVRIACRGEAEHGIHPWPRLARSLLVRSSHFESDQRGEIGSATIGLFANEFSRGVDKRAKGQDAVGAALQEAGAEVDRVRRRESTQRGAGAGGGG